MGIGDILADIGNFSNPYGAPSQGKWNLSRGLFRSKTSNKTCVFFYEEKSPEEKGFKTAVDSINDVGGRRIAVYQYPYRDGQRLDDLGRKGETYTFNIKFHGENYQNKFKEFLDNVVNVNEPGFLNHPTRSGQPASVGLNGSIPVRFGDYDFVHIAGEWNAITIKATFIEDNTDTLAHANVPAASADSALRSALQTLTNVQSTIQQAIFEVGALLNLPGAIVAAMQQRLGTIVSQGSALLGKLASTFSSDAHKKAISAQASSVGGVSNLTAGTTSLNTTGSSQSSQLPPVYQVGFDPTTQAAITAQINAYVNANQVTPQQAVFLANTLRAAISAAIVESQTNFGNFGYDVEVAYRGVAVSMQQAVEASVSSAQSLIKRYTVPYPMSLRKVAFLNNLTQDSQNTIEALNPYLASVNYIEAGTVLTVPAA